MKPLMSSPALIVALVALGSVGITQVAGIALAQAPEKGNQPAARPGTSGGSATIHGTGSRSASDSTAKPAAATGGRATSTATARH